MTRHLPARTLAALFLLSAGVQSASAQAVAEQAKRAARPPARAWTMTWHDEFSGAAIDTTKWDFDLGNGFYADSGKTLVPGWGNGELECYTGEPANAFVQRGMLHIRAEPSKREGCQYTSARMKTRARDGRPLFAARYGRFEVRAKSPLGKGLWPALWMLPLTDQYGTWAASGEIDIMEPRLGKPGNVVGTLHYGSRWPGNVSSGKDYVLPHRSTIAGFHVYALEWEPGRIRWFVDEVPYQTQTFWWSSSLHNGRDGVKPARESDLNAWPAPFDQPFYLILNLAVGGMFMGNPDATTPFPAELVVDYVRVYEKKGGYGAPVPRGPATLPFAMP